MARKKRAVTNQAYDDAVQRLSKGLERAFTSDRGDSMKSTTLYGDETLIFSISNVLSRSECQHVRDFAEQRGFTRTTQAQSKEYAFRDNGRMQVRSPEIAAALWKRLQRFVPDNFDNIKAIGLNDNIRVYKYGTQQRFGQHVDESEVDPETGFESRYTVLVYLNDSSDSPLIGGRTIFYKDAISSKKQKVALAFSPCTGTALLHGHGHNCLLHEGEVVTAGNKFLLRTDVMYAPP